MAFETVQLTAETGRDRKVYGRAQSLVPGHYGQVQLGEKLSGSALEDGRFRRSNQQLDTEVVVEQR
ncbi:hypothetical protein [Streptomyces platensis]|uniref:hypothetical protein n=1 Tax=Streptomyces platensis TaxID=58346 RepID=UPI002E822754|nr:hypothetical protein [Streptomyces platensis]